MFLTPISLDISNCRFLSRELQPNPPPPSKKEEREKMKKSKKERERTRSNEEYVFLFVKICPPKRTTKLLIVLENFLQVNQPFLGRFRLLPMYYPVFFSFYFFRRLWRDSCGPAPSRRPCF